MDLNQIKSEADKRAEYNEYSNLYEIEKKVLKQQEITNIRAAFVAYFEADSDFIITETAEKISAVYKDSSIILTTNTELTEQDTSLSAHLTLQLADDTSYDIQSVAFLAATEVEPPSSQSDEDWYQGDIDYFQRFLDGEVVEGFQYQVKGTAELYPTIGELIDAL